MDLESSKEEKIQLEKKLRACKDSLGEILFKNDSLLHSKKAKIEALSDKEKVVAVLKAKNDAEMEQLESEKTVAEDHWRHELSIQEDSLERLQFMRDRFYAMEKENDQLEKEVEAVLEKAVAENYSHAESLHQINRAMRDKRQNMEETLKKELNSMDMCFQKEAFASLTDKKKKEMLTNAKLKDELILQGIGMTNLGVRLGRQTQSCEQTNGVIRSLERKARSLRGKISLLKSKESARSATIIQLQEEKEELIANQIQMRKAYQLAKKSNIEHVVRQQEIRLDQELCLLKMWNERSDCLMDIKNEMKPVTTLEKGGIFYHSYQTSAPIIEINETNKAIAYSEVNAQDATTENVPKKEVGSKVAHVTYSAIASIMKQDTDFAQAMAPLENKDSCLLKEQGKALLDYNATAWLVSKIMSTWCVSKNDNLVRQNELAASYKDVTAILDALKPRINTASSPSRKQQERKQLQTKPSALTVNVSEPIGAEYDAKNSIASLRSTDSEDSYEDYEYIRLLKECEDMAALQVGVPAGSMSFNFLLEAERMKEAEKLREEEDAERMKQVFEDAANQVAEPITPLEVTPSLDGSISKSVSGGASASTSLPPSLASSVYKEPTEGDDDESQTSRLTEEEMQDLWDDLNTEQTHNKDLWFRRQKVSSVDVTVSNKRGKPSTATSKSSDKLGRDSVKHADALLLFDLDKFKFGQKVSILPPVSTLGTVKVKDKSAKKKSGNISSSVSVTSFSQMSPTHSLQPQPSSLSRSMSKLMNQDESPVIATAPTLKQSLSAGKDPLTCNKKANLSKHAKSLSNIQQHKEGVVDAAHFTGHQLTAPVIPSMSAPTLRKHTSGATSKF